MGDTITRADPIKALTETARGRVVTASDPDYDDARAVCDHITFMSGDDDRRVADDYGANYERLCAGKAAYDPDNLVHVNQNIAPANGR